MQLDKVLVFGLGKVGKLVATLLQQSNFIVTGVDHAPESGLSFPTQRLELSDPAQFAMPFGQCDAVVSCLPYHLNTGVAKAAHAAGIHYFDLTEDVAATQVIRNMSMTSTALMAPQCGLAPGFIGIVGAHLASHFEQLRSIEFRTRLAP